MVGRLPMREAAVSMGDLKTSTNVSFFATGEFLTSRRVERTPAPRNFRIWLSVSYQAW